MNVTLSSAKTRKKFRINKLKASLALVQKLLPCTAHMMYAFLFKNCRNFSKHQKKHFRQHKSAFVTALSYFLHCWSKYSKNTRIIRQIVSMSDPKAKVPKWYRIVRPTPRVSVKNGTSDLWNVQYQVAKVAASTISPNAEIKNTPQKKPTTLIAFLRKDTS